MRELFLLDDRRQTIDDLTTFVKELEARDIISTYCHTYPLLTLAVCQCNSKLPVLGPANKHSLRSNSRLAELN